MASDTQSLLDKIPDEQEVRRRIAENQREAALLRKLLRVAKEKTDTIVSEQSARQGLAMRREPTISATPTHGRKLTGRTSRITEGPRGEPRQRRGSDVGRKCDRVPASAGPQVAPGPSFYQNTAHVSNSDLLADDERSISLGAARLRPEMERDGNSPAPGTIHTWTTRGCRGVVLESWLNGGVKVTSAAAIRRFLDKLNQGERVPAAGAISRDRQRQHRQAEALLDRAGI
jgi:hypothetical protein